MSMIGFLKDLINIPSLSGQEADLAERVKKEFKKLGYDEIGIVAGNVYAKRGNGSVNLVYDAHMDVVEPGNGWQEDPFIPREQSGYIYGRGSCDDKASLASIVYGGSRAALDGISLYILASVNEEVAEGNGLKNFLSESGLKPDYVLIAEPSSLRVARGNRGRIAVKIEVNGEAGHASRPENGVNSIYRASEIIDNIKDLNETLDGESVVVTKVETSNKNINIIPELCSIYCDFRSKAGTTEKMILEKLSKCIGKRDKAFAVSPYYFPWEYSESETCISAALKCMKKITGKSTHIVWDFCTNGSYTAGELGIPSFGFGPGFEDDAHTSHERVEIKQVEIAEEFYSEFPSFLSKELNL